MDLTVLWIIIAIIVIILIVVGVIVAVGNKRKAEKTVSFEKKDERDPKELTQQEKSGNYQAQGGFNFAPASAEPKPEKEPVRVDKPVDTEVASRPASSLPEDKEPEVSDSERLSTAGAAVSGGAGAAAVAGVAKVTESQSEAEAEEAVAADEDTPDINTPSQDAEVEVSREPAEAVEQINNGTDDKDDVVVEETVVEETVVEEEVPEESAEVDEPADVVEVVEEVEVIEDAPEPEAEPEPDPDTEGVPEDPIEQAEQAASIAAVTADVVADAREQTEVPEDGPLDSPAPSEPLEDIAPVSGRIGKLRGRLSRSQNAIGQGLLGILTAGDLDEDAWEEIEDTLIMADLGAPLTMKVTDILREKIAERGVASEDEARAMLRETLIEVGRPDLDRSIKALPNNGKPAVILVVGVNGTGKTTTTGKLARVLVAMGSKVVLGAADTFRAAAADQLETWGRRVGATTVRGAEGADPASVAFDAVARGVEEQADVVIVDTAGRLHTSTGLMDQLGKVKRVVEKKSTVDEVLLVLDATVGQNGLTQARVFRDVVDITGVVLTKLDGTAKGGIVFQVQEELGVPVKLVGLGEGADDLAPFEVEGFVDALLG